MANCHDAPVVVGLMFYQNIMKQELYTALTSKSTDVARGVELTIPVEIPQLDQLLKAIRYAYCWIDPVYQSLSQLWYICYLI